MPNVLRLAESRYSVSSNFITRNKQVYWHDDHLKFIHYSSINYADALARFPDTLVAQFKSLVIDWINLSQYSEVSHHRFFGNFRTLLLQADSSLNLAWLSSITEEKSFKRSYKSVANFLLFLSQRSNDFVKDGIELLILQVQVRRSQSSNVLSDDPTLSALTNFEFDALVRKTWNDYESKNIDTQTALVRLLSYHYYRRPAQISQLKIGDIFFDFEKDISNIRAPRIFFPGVKDLYSESSFRASKFEYRPLADHLIDLIRIQIEDVRQVFEEYFNIDIDEAGARKLPLFTSKKIIDKAIIKLENRLRLDPTRHLDHQVFHLSAVTVGLAIKHQQNIVIHSSLATASNPPISHRTNNALVVTATRMRHSNAFFLARKGVSRADLTNILGHASGISVNSYYQDPAEDARKLNEAIGSQLTQVAMAFSGKLINKTEKRNLISSSPQTILQHATKDYQLHSVGNCGKHSFCASQTIPIPCYKCNNFQPFVDANHQEVLDALLIRQRQENETICQGSSKNLLQPIDLSIDIECVKSVIAQCNEYKRNNTPGDEK